MRRRCSTCCASVARRSPTKGYGARASESTRCARRAACRARRSSTRWSRTSVTATGSPRSRSTMRPAPRRSAWWRRSSAPTSGRLACRELIATRVRRTGAAYGAAYGGGALARPSPPSAVGFFLDGLAISGAPLPGQHDRARNCQEYQHNCDVGDRRRPRAQRVLDLVLRVDREHTAQVRCAFGREQQRDECDEDGAGHHRDDSRTDRSDDALAGEETAAAPTHVAGQLQRVEPTHTLL